MDKPVDTVMENTAADLSAADLSALDQALARLTSPAGDGGTTAYSFTSQMVRYEPRKS